MYKNVPRKFLPVVWFEQHFRVDKDLALLINLAVNVDLFGQLLGFLIALISLLWMVLIISKKDKQKIESQEVSTRQMKMTRLPESTPLMI
jgi:L-asparagine transporter-like permease